MSSPHDRVIGILNEVKELLALPDTDVIWGGYDTPEEVIQVLDSHIARLKERDMSRRGDLELMFAPTACLQEISISNGWGEKFLDIASRFDAAMEEI